MGGPVGCKAAGEWGMGLKPGRSRAEGEYLLGDVRESLGERITALGDMPLLARVIRFSQVPGNLNGLRQLGARKGGFGEPTFVVSPVILHAMARAVSGTRGPVLEG